MLKRDLDAKDEKRTFTEDKVKKSGRGRKIFGRTIALLLIFGLLVATNSLPPVSTATKAVDYPYILVHGLGGWGRDEGINETIPYWGATTGNLAEFLNGQGYTVFEASVGPLSSAWDRACELYAQLMGTRVDYGEAHSAANKHARYGRTYESPMFEGWGSKDAYGQIKKINLVGHSFGGLTVRLLVSLLENGDSEEVAAGGDECSPLFKGGHGDWIHSVTTVCSPNNGTTLASAIESTNILDPLLSTVIAYTMVAGNSPLSGYVDFHLEQFGITHIPGENRSIDEIIRDLALFEGTGTDNAAYDMFPDTQREMNKRISFVEGVYYSSYSFSTTVENPFTSTHYPKATTNPILMVPAMLIGHFTNSLHDGEVFDSKWFANDGLVSVYSARNPKGEPWQEFDGEKLVLGKWNVMPTMDGDHGTAIGLLGDKEETHKLYVDMFELIEATR